MKEYLTWKQLYALSTEQERIELVFVMLRWIEKRQKREAIERKIKAISNQLLAEISEIWTSLPWLSRKLLRLKFEWFLFLSRLQKTYFVCKARLRAWWSQRKTRCWESARNQERVTVGRR